MKLRHSGCLHVRTAAAVYVLFGILLSQGIQLGTVQAQAPEERAQILEDVEQGRNVPEVHTRLGAYAATGGYRCGQVGYAVHNAIRSVYRAFGAAGEERIGEFFRSEQVRKLLALPLTEDTSLEVATLEFNYWKSVLDANPNSEGGKMGTYFPIGFRDWLQRSLFSRCGTDNSENSPAPEFSPEPPTLPDPDETEEAPGPSQGQPDTDEDESAPDDRALIQQLCNDPSYNAPPGVCPLVDIERRLERDRQMRAETEKRLMQDQQKAIQQAINNSRPSPRPSLNLSAPSPITSGSGRPNTTSPTSTPPLPSPSPFRPSASTPVG